MRALWQVVSCEGRGCEGFVACGSVHCEGFVALFKDMSGCTCVALFMAVWDFVSLCSKACTCSCVDHLACHTIIRLLHDILTGLRAQGNSLPRIVLVSKKASQPFVASILCQRPCTRSLCEVRQSLLSVLFYMFVSF